MTVDIPEMHRGGKGTKSLRSELVSASFINGLNYAPRTESAYALLLYAALWGRYTSATYNQNIRYTFYPNQNVRYAFYPNHKTLKLL